MRKIVMLSVAIIAISGMTISQADDVLDTPVETTIAEVVEAKDASIEELAGESVAAVDTSTPRASDGVAKPQAESETLGNSDAEKVIIEAPVVVETPQVLKLMALYPQLIARIHPYAQVCYIGEECDITLTASGGSVDGEPRDGKAVYNAVCQTCHASGLLGSPKIGDAGAWGPRIGKGVDTLYNHAINGFNAMPAKGGADIPDEEVQNAVDYMIEQSS